MKWEQLRENVWCFVGKSGFYIRLYAPGALFPGVAEPLSSWVFSCEGRIVCCASVVQHDTLETAQAEVIKCVRSFAQAIVDDLE